VSSYSIGERSPRSKADVTGFEPCQHSQACGHHVRGDVPFPCDIIEAEAYKVTSGREELRQCWKRGMPERPITWRRGADPKTFQLSPARLGPLPRNPSNKGEFFSEIETVPPSMRYISGVDDWLGPGKRSRLCDYYDVRVRK
jgi:hypothetical protein